MSIYPCPVGRREAAALASMNVRAKVTQSGVEYVARPLKQRPLACRAAAKVGPRFQPRDALGRFVSYARLRHAIGVDLAHTVNQ